MRQQSISKRFRLDQRAFITTLESRHNDYYGQGCLGPWHKGGDVQELIESTGARLLKLPPYSPGLKPD
ncbi:MAG: hypothetical protein AAF228_11710 [Pseudomonadota bacterium]